LSFFFVFLLGLPIAIQAATPPLRLCGGVILIEEEPEYISSDSEVQP
jgi:hypothetical protein